MNRIHWQDWLLALLGVGLVALPFLPDYALAEGVRGGWVTLSFAASGLAIAALAVAAALSDQGWEEWAIAAVGVWVALSPWLLGFGGTAILSWAAVALGLAALALALWSFADATRQGRA